MFSTEKLPQSLINVIKLDSKIDFEIKAFVKLTDQFGSEELLPGKAKKLVGDYGIFKND